MPKAAHIIILILSRVFNAMAVLGLMLAICWYPPQ
jgi:hypothetical protein